MKTSRIVLYAVLGLAATAMVLPFLWTLYASFVSSDLNVNQWNWDLSAYSFDNYAYIFTESRILTWYKNSLLVTLSITAANLMFNTMAGYALARLALPGKKILFLTTLGLMMIPVQILFIPIFVMMAKLGWVNTYAALIVPFIVNPFGVFLMRQFYVDFPKELEEAAKMDGLRPLAIFFRIALPLSKPGLIAQAIFIFVWNWNSFPFPSILATTEDMFTLPVGIYQITNTAFTSSVTKSMAGVVAMTIPTLAFFIAFQKHFTANVAQSGIKG
ncbi:carbohydrate ABC transporter permease [Paenibacillus sp. J5C_2022]|uniref:carbohydrate ABC transporter permease n=1 Tax=Paenibacillus sp. J5C2022 TaxID=2977129 RepID=UPI0021D08D9E|nr:carbohydrate ABC transporter permease [Paenibacillus sp. J5C2022]MCU6708738.1 carbohydrate ABC transporter permease [Paenibacillus sp. J5C2022]